NKDPLPLVKVNGELEFEVAEILGYEGTDEETSWLLAMELDHASELVEEFHSCYPRKPGPLHTL
ncbi:hypothetical protein ID866_12023, partial [Astraeus odoratus]